MGRFSVEGELPLREIPELEEGQSYKYLGVAQRMAQVVQSNQERVVQEYMRRVRKVWDTKLNARSRMLLGTECAPVLLQYLPMGEKRSQVAESQDEEDTHAGESSFAKSVH